MYEYGSEAWSTPSSLIAEFESRGHHVQRFHLSEVGISQFMSSDIIWDILLVMDWKGLNFQRLDKQYMREGMWVVSETADCPQNFDKHLALADRYHTLLCPAYDSTEKFKALGYDCEFFTHWADTRIYQPSSDIPTIDVVSSRGPGGSQFLDYMSQALGAKFINRNGFMGKDHGRFLASGKIVLQNSRHHEWTRRIPEAMSVNRLVITDKLPEHTNVDSLYIDGEDYVTYEGVDDCISKINYYLSNTAERERIAMNGYTKTIANHTQVQRVDIIIQKYNEWKRY